MSDDHFHRLLFEKKREDAVSDQIIATGSLVVERNDTDGGGGFFVVILIVVVDVVVIFLGFRRSQTEKEVRRSLMMKLDGFDVGHFFKRIFLMEIVKNNETLMLRFENKYNCVSSEILNTATKFTKH